MQITSLICKRYFIIFFAETDATSDRKRGA